MSRAMPARIGATSGRGAARTGSARAGAARRGTTRSYVYMAEKAGGGRSFGVLAAAGERGLAEALRRDRRVLLRAWALPSWVETGGAFSLRDQMALNEQLAQLVSRGVPLVEALEVCASVVRGSQRGRVLKMRERVAAGSSFADAARDQGGFDRVTVAIYRAAERTGDLAGAGQQLAAAARRELGIRGKAVTLMIYPAIVATIGIGAGVLMLTAIVPRIGASLADAGLELPAYTRFVMGLGAFLRGYWVELLGAVVVLATLSVVGRATLAKWLGRLSRFVPLLKDVVLTQESARFFSVMGAMSRAGVPLADGLGTSVAAVGHAKLRRQLDTLRSKLVAGGVLGKLIDDVDALPLATRRLLIAADRAGDMESAFSTLAQDMADRLDKQTARLLAGLEPLLIVLLFIFIGALLMSIMIPLLTMVGGQIG